MALADRDYMKAGEQEASPSLLLQLNEFGERHAKLIIFLSTVVIIVAVLIVADTLWRKSRRERALSELDGATRIEDLEKVREEYGGDETLLPRMLYRLGNLYQHEAGGTTEGPDKARELLEKGKALYREFLDKFGTGEKVDPLTEEVRKALATLEENLRFLDTELGSMKMVPTLLTHPRSEAELEDSPIRFGPTQAPNPVVRIDFPDRGILVELFEDEAPNTVANFVDLCSKGYFNGLKFSRSEDGKRLRIAQKEEGAVSYMLPFEESGREAQEGMLVMARAEGRAENLGAEFLILLEQDAGPAAGTIFGRVKEGGLSILRFLKEDEAVLATPVDRKRDHEYAPMTVEP